MLLETLEVSLLGNMLIGNGILRAGTEKRGIGNLRASCRSKKKKLIPPHPLTNIEIQKYYQNEPRFNRIYSRYNFPKNIKNGSYVIMHM